MTMRARRDVPETGRLASTAGRPGGVVFGRCHATRGGGLRDLRTRRITLPPHGSTTMTDTTINPAETAKFSAMAEEWWDPAGKFSPLHKFNPVRLSYIRDHAMLHFGKDGGARRPLEGLRILDIGCGGGLLCEPMARLGATVTGIDVVERNIAVAQLHAAQSGLDDRLSRHHRRSARRRRRQLRHRPQHGSGRARRQRAALHEELRHIDGSRRPSLYRHPQPHPPRPRARGVRRREHTALAARAAPTTGTSSLPPRRFARS